MEKVLNITLNRVWFDMIARGEKREEYREIKPYWIQRLCYHEFNKFSPDDLIEYSDKPEIFMGKPYLPFRKNYDIVLAKNGYGSNVPALKFIPGSIRIGTPNAKWISPDYNGNLLFIIPILQILTVTK